MRPMIRRSFTVVLTILLAAASLVLATPASAQTASISGTVLDAQTGQPPAFGACVIAWNSEGTGIVAATCIDLQTGAFSLTELEAGVGYRIEISPGGDIYPMSTWLPGGPTVNDAVPVVAPTTLDIRLPRAGTLTGTLTQSDGAPAVGKDVVVWMSTREEAFGRSAVTASDGTWTINQLYPTPYKVSLECCWPAWAYGKTDWASADVIDLPAGATVRVDDILYLPASISGRVTDALTGEPVATICLSLRNVDPEGGGGWSEGCTDASGQYKAVYVTPGQYKAAFTDPLGRYAISYYGGDDWESATVITVARGGQVTGIDGVVTPGATVTGRAIDSRTRQPVSGVCPLAYQGRDGGPIEFQQQECSEADGRWRLSALPAAPTTIQLLSFGTYQSVWLYNSDTQARATLFKLEPGETVTTRDVRLRPL